MFLLYTTYGTIFKKGTMTDWLRVEVLSCNNKIFNSKMTDKWVIQVFPRNGKKWAMNLRKMMDTANVKFLVKNYHFENLFLSSDWESFL